MRSIPILVAFLCLPLSAQTITFVNQGAQGTNSGASWINAFTDLQAALAATTTSGEIWVAEGTYLPASVGAPATATFALRDGVAILGGFAGTELTSSERDPALYRTILSGDLIGNDAYDLRADNVNHVVTGSGNNPSAVLDGVVIAGGAGAARGGGLIIINGSPTLHGVTIRENRASEQGGGMYIDGGMPTLTDCTFSQNRAPQGAGLYAESLSGSWLLERCRFIRNRSTASAAFSGIGAGLCLASGINAVIRHGIFVGNLTTTSMGTETKGGGMSHAGATLFLERCTFTANTSSLGGGVYSTGQVTASNSVFSANEAFDAQGAVGGEGGGIWCVSGSMAHCTVSANYATHKGGGITSGGFSVINSILWGNTVTPPPPSEDPIWPLDIQIDASASLSYCAAEGVFTGIPGEDPPNPANFPGCTDANPAFADASTQGLFGMQVPRDLTLASNSPCIDAGDSSTPLSLLDRGGNARAIDDPATPNSGAGAAPITDMGAFEYGLGTSALPQTAFAWTPGPIADLVDATVTSANRSVAFRMWTMGDGKVLHGAEPKHTYTSSFSPFSVRLWTWDSGGALGVPAVQSVTVTDTTAPTATLLSPPAGPALGTLSMAATASDDGHVVSVRYRMNGQVIGGYVTQPPWTLTWNSLALPDGNYALTAEARDVAGNIGVSAPRMVELVNYAPVFQFPPSQTSFRVGVGRTFTYYPHAAGPAIAYTLTTAPSGAQVDSTGLVTWTPGPSDLGRHLISIEATNNSGTINISLPIFVTSAPFVVTVLDMPGSINTMPFGINDLGQVVGSHWNQRADGFLFDGTNYTNLVFQPAIDLWMYDINDSGVISATSYESGGWKPLRYTNGSFSYIPYNGYENHPVGINNAGQMAGWTIGAPNSPTGAYGPCGAVNLFGGYNRGFGINDTGLSVGDGYGNGNARHGYVDNCTTGITTPFQVEGSSTTAYGINDYGHVVGIHSSGGTGGSFLCYDGSTNLSVYHPIRVPGALVSTARDINDNGVIVGRFEDANSDWKGFMAVPATDYRQENLRDQGPGSLSLEIIGEQLTQGRTADLNIAGGVANQLGWLGVGSSSNPVPAAGGVIVPSLDVGIFPLPLDGLGNLNLPGIPGGGGPYELYVQFIAPDPATPFGYSISNAVRAEFLP